MEDLKSKSPLALLIYGLIAIVIVIYAANPMSVTVTGTGESSVTATNATVSFTLTSTDSNSPQNAILNVNAKALAMRTFLKGKGIAESDIAQSQVTAVPSSLVTSGTSGYQASISMAAKTTQVSEISTLISGLYSQGAGVVSQPVLSVENQDKLSQAAFSSAMSDAKSQAGRVGLSNFKFIRKIVGVSQASSPSTSTSTIQGNTQDALSASNGVFKIVKVVSVTYKMW